MFSRTTTTARGATIQCGATDVVPFLHCCRTLTDTDLDSAPLAARTSMDVEPSKTEMASAVLPKDAVPPLLTESLLSFFPLDAASLTDDQWFAACDTLVMTDDRLTVDDFQRVVIRRPRRVATLDLSGTTYAADDALRVFEHSKVRDTVRSLILNECWFEGSEVWRSVNLFPDLRSVSLAGVQTLDSRAVAVIAEAQPKLRALDLSGTKVDDTCLVPLAESCPLLDTLHLDGINVTQEGLRQIARLRCIEYLSLKCVAVIDAAVAATLRYLPLLREVVLSKLEECTTTAGALFALQSKERKLKVVTMKHCSVSVGAEKMLELLRRKCLVDTPGCTIESEHATTTVD